MLGTGKLIEKGRVNQHLVQRIDAAAALYRRGKVRRLILSGDKGRDEPMEMKRALLQRGVPESAWSSTTTDCVRSIRWCERATYISVPG